MKPSLGEDCANAPPEALSYGASNFAHVSLSLRVEKVVEIFMTLRNRLEDWPVSVYLHWYLYWFYLVEGSVPKWLQLLMNSKGMSGKLFGTKHHLAEIFEWVILNHFSEQLNAPTLFLKIMLIGFFIIKVKCLLPLGCLGPQQASCSPSSQHPGCPSDPSGQPWA